MKAISLGGFEVAIHAIQHVHMECQVSTNLDMIKKTLWVVGLKSKAKQKKLKLNYKHIKD